MKNTTSTANRRSLLATSAALAIICIASSGCFPLVATGVVVGALATADRRTYGAQTDDQAIELKSAGRLNEGEKRLGGVSVTSYNRKVLLTGQVLNENDKKLAEQLVMRVDNVRSVHNELVVSGRTGIGAATSDSTTTAKVKTTFLDAKDVQANTIKVVTESGVVYLMGLVTQREGQRAADLASRVSGVAKVVTVWEIISESELERLRPSTPPAEAKPQ